MRKKIFREYFAFSRRERRAVFLLLALICLLFLLPHWLPDPPDVSPDFSDFKQAIAAFERRKDSVQLKTAGHNNGRHNAKAVPAAAETALFPFDPNTLDEQGWRRLGVKASVAHTIQHYQAAGGHFYQREDLRKIYGLREDIYRRLAPYVRIRKKKQSLTKAEKREKQDSSYLPRPFASGSRRYNVRRPSLVLDINRSDSLAWVRLRGIGPVLAGRILRFREKLGGFYSIEQIGQVYGLPDSTFREIKRWLKLDSVDLKKININTATIEELKSHPYISYRLAAAIKAFRDQHGPFGCVEDLKQVALVDDRIYRKLAPYLATD